MKTPATADNPYLALCGIENAYQNYVHHGLNTTVPKAFFLSRLAVASENETLFNDSETQVKLAKYWLWYIDSYFNNPEDVELQMEHIDQCISLIARENILNELRNDDTLANTIAALCLKRVNAIKYMYPLKNEHNVSHLIGQWVGLDKIDDAALTLKDTVDALYGPACWGLFRDEVVDDGQLPFLLLKLQLIRRVDKNVQKESLHQLPENFGM